MLRDPKICKKIGTILIDIQKHPYEGLGKPEPLKGELQGWWSRHITGEHRLVYRIDGNTLYIRQCKGHYDDK